MVNQVILITINHYEPAIAEQDYHEASVACEIAFLSPNWAGLGGAINGPNGLSRRCDLYILH